MSLWTGCVMENCYLRRFPEVSMCSQKSWLCQQVWASVDPEDMGTYEDWVKEHRERGWK